MAEKVVPSQMSQSVGGVPVYHIDIEPIGGPILWSTGSHADVLEL